MRAAAEEYEEAQKRIDDANNATLKQTADAVEGVLGQGLYDALDGNFKNIGTSFLRMLKKMAADALAAQVVQSIFGVSSSSSSKGGLGSLFGGSGGSGGSSGGSILSGLGSLFGSMSGGGGGGGSWLGSAVSGISSLFGFSEGGYTGAGAKYQPAGVVHKGEYVINAAATSKINRAFLDGLNGYAEGGYVGAASQGSAMFADAQAEVATPTTGSANVSVNYAPSVVVDSRSDRGAVMAEMNKLAAQSNKEMVEYLKRVKLLPP